MWSTSACTTVAWRGSPWPASRRPRYQVPTCPHRQCEDSKGEQAGNQEQRPAPGVASASRPGTCESASALTPNPAVPASRRSRAGRGAGMATGNRRIRASTARRCNNAPATVRSDPAREQQDREDASRGPNERSRRTRRHSRHQGDKHPGRQASARGQSAEQADPRARKRHAATPAGSRREAQRRP